MFTANHFLEAFRRPLTSACDCPAERQAGHSQVFHKAKTSTSCKSFNYSSTIALPSSGMFNEIVYSKVRSCYWSIKEEAQDTKRYTIQAWQRFLMFAKVLKCCTRQTSSRCLCRLLHPSAACLFTCLPVRTGSHLSHHHYLLQDAHVSLMVLVGVCGRWVLMLCQGT